MEIFLGKSEADSGGGKGMVFYFDSEPPASFAQAPFDHRNAFEIIKNSCAFNYCTLNYNQDSEMIELGPYYPRHAGDVDPCSLLNIPYLDTNLNLWRLFPKFCVNEASWVKEKAGDLDIDTMMDGMRTAILMMLAMCNDPDEYVEGNSSPQFYVTQNRYAYQDPFIVEFETEQEISHIAVHQTHANSNYDNTFFDLDIWNETTEEWDRAQRVSYAGVNAKSLVPLNSPITAKTIRLVPGDTGRYGWILKYITFYNANQPANVPVSKDVKWCVVLPYWGGLFNRYSGTTFDTNNISSSFVENTGCPALALTVGDNNTFGALYVKNATALEAKSKVEPVSLQLFLE